MLEKFEVVCLVGTNKLKYSTITKSNGSDEYHFRKHEFKK